MKTQISKFGGAKCTLLAAAASVLLCVDAHAANLVTNGDFETGSFSGWQTAAAGAGVGADESLFGVDGNGPHHGTYSAYFGASAPSDTISQSLATTAGTTYDISFYLDSEGTQGAAAGFVGTFGGTTFVNLSGASANQVFSPDTFFVTATSSSTLLSFAAYDTNSYYTLDDVSVVAVAAPVPEPSSLALLLVGLTGGVGVACRRSRLNSRTR